MKDYLCADCNRAFGKMEDLTRHRNDVHQKKKREGLREYEAGKVLYQRKANDGQK